MTKSAVVAQFSGSMFRVKFVPDRRNFAPWFPCLDLSWPAQLLWLLHSLAASRGWLSDHVWRPLLLTTRWRWKWIILDLLKAMPCLRWSLVLRKNDALRIGRKDFVEPVFMISLDVVFCDAVVVDAGETLRRLKISFSVRSATALPDVIILARLFPFRYHKLLVECNDNISPYSSSVFPAHASSFIMWIYDEFSLF